MRRRLVGGGALVAVAWLAGAGQAQADNDTFFVDSTERRALTDCFPAAGCSLRGAFSLANDNDPDGHVDTIILNINLFDGVETVPGEATIAMAGAGLSTDEDLNVQANCSVTAPCAGIDGPPGDIAIRVEAAISTRGASRSSTATPASSTQTRATAPTSQTATSASSLTGRSMATRPASTSPGRTQRWGPSTSLGTSSPGTAPGCASSATRRPTSTCCSTASGSRPTGPSRRTRPPTSTSPATSPTRRRATSTSAPPPRTRPPRATRAAT